MSQIQQVDSFTAGADLSSNAGYVVVRSGANVILGTDGTIAGGEIGVGILHPHGDGENGDRVSVVTLGRTRARAGGVLTRGTHQFLTWDATGRLVAASAGDVVIAEWVDDGSDAAAAAGDWIEVLVIPQLYGGGTIGGSTGAVDNVILRANGVGGTTIQGGGVATLSDAGVIGAATGLAVGAAAPDASALVEFAATDKGFLPPRMTGAERAAIAAPVEGLLVFDTDDNTVYQYSGAAWVAVLQGDLDTNDNRLVRVDGAGGFTAQGSVVTLDDAGAMSGLTGLTLASGNITLTQAGATVDGLDLDTAIRGALGADDNRLLRSDGAGGVTAQGSAITVDDAGAMSGLTGLTLDSGNITLSQAGATVDGRDLTTDGAVIDGLRVVTAAPAAEAANVIAVTLNVTDANGNAVNAATRVMVQAYSPNATTITLSETGAGSTVWVSGATVAPAICVDTDASGDATVSVAYADAGTVGFVATVAPSSGASVHGFPISLDLNFT